MKVILKSAHADDAPVKMEMVDAAQLDAALAHIRELESAARPYNETVIRLCTKYKIQPSELGRTVGVDFASGTIQRAPKAQGK